MARYNRFGAVYTDVMAMFPGTILADYDGGGDSGQTIIEGVLDRIAREVASSMTPDVYKQFTEVDCQQIVRYATAAQTTASLGLVPVIAGTLHIWIYPPLAALELNERSDGGPVDDFWYRKPVLGYNEETGFSLNATTGAVTALRELNAGERVFASYDVDVDNAAFSMPSVKDIVVLGAAAELGSRLYSDASQEWKLVDEYRSRYRGAMQSTPGQEGGTMGRALAGTFVPDELRKLTYWSEVERKSDEGVGSFRRYRG